MSKNKTKIITHCIAITMKKILPAQKNNYRICFSWNEAKQKDITTATIVTFQLSFTKWTVLMKGYFFMLCPDKMVDDMAISKQKLRLQI